MLPNDRLVHGCPVGVDENGTTTYKRYIGGVLVQNVVGGLAANRYLFQDHQGSVVKATNEAGTVLEGGGFNAFGERRVNGSATALTTTGLSSTSRGYTGHEMLDGLDVIHMNGRIYDPTLGRFLQPDPVIQAPDNPQNWNAYTYVFNNPHRYTDPTGMMGIEERKWLSGIIAVVAAIFQQYYISIGAWGTAFGVAVIGGFASSYVATGTLRGGILGAFGAALTVGITGMSLGPYAEILMRGFSGGIMDVLGGGNFGNGFFGAALGAGVSIGMGRLPITSAVGKIVARAIAGGTASVATGGKFASGALSAAFIAAVDGISKDGSHSSPDGRGAKSMTGEEYAAMQDDFEALSPRLRSIRKGSPQATADAFGAAALPFTEKWGFEIGANIVGRGSNFRIADVTLGYFGTLTIPENSASIADVHTHPRGGPGFSGAVTYTKAGGLRAYEGDMNTNYRQNIDGYVYRVGGGVWRFNQGAFRNDLTAAMKNGVTIDSRWGKYVEQIR